MIPLVDVAATRVSSLSCAHDGPHDRCVQLWREPSSRSRWPRSGGRPRRSRIPGSCVDRRSRRHRRSRLGRGRPRSTASRVHSMVTLVREGQVRQIAGGARRRRRPIIAAIPTTIIAVINNITVTTITTTSTARVVVGVVVRGVFGVATVPVRRHQRWDREEPRRRDHGFDLAPLDFASAHHGAAPARDVALARRREHEPRRREEHEVHRVRNDARERGSQRHGQGSNRGGGRCVRRRRDGRRGGRRNGGQGAGGRRRRDERRAGGVAPAAPVTSATAIATATATASASATATPQTGWKLGGDRV